MITTSGTSFAKRAQFQSGSMSNILLRTDGFKKVVKGLSYKKMGNSIVKSGHNIHTSMGKRTVMRQYEINNQNEGKEEDLHDNERNYENRRTKTANLLGRNGRKNENQDRQKRFIENERSEIECFKSLWEKLGI